MTGSPLYDVFICHASEDKDEFVRPLVDELRSQNVEVWYDEFSLKVGDSIRRTIDHGLRSCRYGIVVLSPAFFDKNWPQYELDGLVGREIARGTSLILPIWHRVDHTRVLTYSPALATKKAITTELPLEKIVKQLIGVIRPGGSPLLVARDVLLQRGLRPPVVTDPYWLEIVEASNRLMSFGAAIPEEATWGRLCFPLPPRDDGPDAWGQRLAWTAMQKQWSEAAEEESISSLTNPSHLLDFIKCFSGLLEACLGFPSLAAEWMPQLTIAGFGGELEKSFEREYLKDCQKSLEQTRISPTFGTANTTMGQSPACDQIWALRHPNFGYYDPSIVANSYFGGQMFGPHPSPHKHADHLFWLLSVRSAWLPERVHEFLVRGHARWGVWLWGDYMPDGNASNNWTTSGRLCDALQNFAGTAKSFKWRDDIKDDLLRRAERACQTLKLPEAPQELVASFHNQNILAEYLAKKAERASWHKADKRSKGISKKK